MDTSKPTNAHWHHLFPCERSKSFTARLFGHLKEMMAVIQDQFYEINCRNFTATAVKVIFLVLFPEAIAFISIVQCSHGRKLCSCHSDHTSFSAPGFWLKQLCFLPFHISHMPPMNRIFAWTWVQCPSKFFLSQNDTLEMLMKLAAHVLVDKKCPHRKLSSKQWKASHFHTQVWALAWSVDP